jgi:hypothetical protein
MKYQLSKGLKHIMINKGNMTYVIFKDPATTKATQNLPPPARAPVISGPALWLNDFATFTTTITAVLSSGKTAADRNAERGAWSTVARV